MEQDGRGDWNPLLAQLRDARDETARRNDDAARADAEEVGVGETADRVDHRSVVRHRLAPAHEDDMGEASFLGREQALGVDRPPGALLRPQGGARRELARWARTAARRTT